jgi:glycosyltransferase involved in cell wall biosynthesis
MTDLLVTSVTPNLSTGSGLRTYGVAAALARHGPVELAFAQWGPERPAPELGAVANLSLRRLTPSRGVSRAVAYGRALARGVPDKLARGVSPELARAAAPADAYARVIADGPVVAAALAPLARRREVVYLAHNLESGFRREPGRRRLARFERRVLRGFSESWMATRADGEGAVALAGGGIRVRYVPNVIDTALVAPVAPVPGGPVLFVADFTYAPNREAISFLAGEVMPLVFARRPETRVLVVGRGLERPPDDRRIEPLGFVEDLGAAYAAAGVVAVPLLHGGGSPLKLIEALARGLPVVATAHAARLLEDAQPGRDLLVAAGARELADALCAVLDDPARAAALGAAGRGLAQAAYSVDALTSLLAP